MHQLLSLVALLPLFANAALPDPLSYSGLYEGSEIQQLVLDQELIQITTDERNANGEFDVVSARIVSEAVSPGPRCHTQVKLALDNGETITYCDVSREFIVIMLCPEEAQEQLGGPLPTCQQIPLLKTGVAPADTLAPLYGRFELETDPSVFIEFTQEHIVTSEGRTLPNRTFFLQPALISPSRATLFAITKNRVVPAGMVYLDGALFNTESGQRMIRR